MPDAGYEVLTGELTAHAGKVDGFADRLQTAVDAARQVTMNNDAYGVICQPFALLLQPFEEMGVNALTKGSETVRETAGTVRDAAKSYDTSEAARASSFRGTDV
ncbi:hypothetical protein JOF56_002082 [Kibdelosporangium banguiense]|uniref:ESX-1 secretion-associated protein n=1 Tax=Kibdelosporangium banguiense TaxID=1365924 RepID=A0ABS4TB99_9PSEU|nr:type VII secretion target [Kibdelosporangium banguiense]MBP2321697.1 hypothetical protein [Kibdelosporangium banguiense]